MGIGIGWTTIVKYEFEICQRKIILSTDCCYSIHILNKSVLTFSGEIVVNYIIL